MNHRLSSFSCRGPSPTRTPQFFIITWQYQTKQSVEIMSPITSSAYPVSSACYPVAPWTNNSPNSPVLPTCSVIPYSIDPSVVPGHPDTDNTPIPTLYQDYLDVFSEDNSNRLPPHTSFDHKIPIEKGKTPPFGPIYPLSQTELQVLSDYLKENLEKGFIRKSSQSCWIPDPFRQKERWYATTLCWLSRPQ